MRQGNLFAVFSGKKRETGNLFAVFCGKKHETGKPVYLLSSLERNVRQGNLLVFCLSSLERNMRQGNLFASCLLWKGM